jgi:predicted transcriptional regulator
MEQETLYTGSKWDILKCLEKGKKSPVDLAKEANTSVANISQQLRLLELAGIVKSERISNRDKGLPRIVYSLTGNNSYLISSSPDFVEKKSLQLEEHQKALLKIWFMNDNVLKSYIEKFFLNIYDIINKIEFLGLDITDYSNIKVQLIGDSTELKKIKDYYIDGTQGKKNFSIHLLKRVDLSKISEKLFVIYDPYRLWEKKENRQKNEA